MDASAPVMSSSAGPLPSSRYATMPSGVRTTWMGAVSTFGPLTDPSTSGLLPDPHPARAAAAQHAASIQLTGNLICSAQAGIMTTCFLTSSSARHRDCCMPRLPDILKIYLLHADNKIY